MKEPTEPKGRGLGVLRAKLEAELEKGAREHRLDISDDLRERIIDDITFQTHTPDWAVRILNHLLAAQEKLPSLHDDELRRERIAHAVEMTAKEEFSPRFQGPAKSGHVKRMARSDRGFEFGH